MRGGVVDERVRARRRRRRREGFAGGGGCTHHSIWRSLRAGPLPPDRTRKRRAPSASLPRARGGRRSAGREGRADQHPKPQNQGLEVVYPEKEKMADARPPASRRALSPAGLDDRARRAQPPQDPFGATHRAAEDVGAWACKSIIVVWTRGVRGEGSSLSLFTDPRRSLCFSLSLEVCVWRGGWWWCARLHLGEGDRSFFECTCCVCRKDNSARAGAQEPPPTAGAFPQPQTSRQWCVPLFLTHTTGW